MVVHRGEQAGSISAIKRGLVQGGGGEGGGRVELGVDAAANAGGECDPSTAEPSVGVDELAADERDAPHAPLGGGRGHAAAEGVPRDLAEKRLPALVKGCPDNQREITLTRRYHSTNSL